MNVIVAMSGGVDSSVAAALLVEQGHNVTGIMLSLWSDPSTQNLCCNQDSLNLAKQVAEQISIPFYTVDESESFYKQVVEYFINSYKQGETPNPCIACNRHVRWNSLFQKAEELGATHVASGHYARLNHTKGGEVQLLRGVDQKKDQSYVLHGLSQNQLAKTLFPIGSFNKNEIRHLAHRYKMSVAERPDSQDLCFVGNTGYRDFLFRHAPDVVNPGPIKNINGKIIGQHNGLAFYTIGQRKGLGISAPQPYFVNKKDIENNVLVVGTRYELGQDELIAENMNWIASTHPKNPFTATVKIRYKSSDEKVTVTPQDVKRIHIKLKKPLRDITPGQSVVIYNGEVCLGGGIII